MNIIYRRRAVPDADSHKRREYHEYGRYQEVSVCVPGGELGAR